ncbi:hypothetical protein [Demequina zhanjiangensis]|uniref:Uncharacterized protein n=1 Tax=Demequina zhanjiangensis TaxID=3051659 RepID=A0ABT8G407_9MICO|nr:hypothetical protein [Demequina sp. SYSU T00b26]MDN4473752.1 hypothetical protein [Demequina sp. SYSU T00b26]
MILAEAAEQGSSIAAQAFFYIAIVVAVGYFGWQFYKGAKENGGGMNYGWLSGPKKKDDAAKGDDAEPAKGQIGPDATKADGDDSSK